MLPIFQDVKAETLSRTVFANIYYSKDFLLGSMQSPLEHVVPVELWLRACIVSSFQIQFMKRLLLLQYLLLLSVFRQIFEYLSIYPSIQYQISIFQTDFECNQTDRQIATAGEGWQKCKIIHFVFCPIFAGKNQSN